MGPSIDRLLKPWNVTSRSRCMLRTWFLQIVAARGGRDKVRAAYRQSIGYMEPPPPPPPPAAAPESVPIGAIVGPAVAGGVLLLGAVVLCLVLRVRRRRVAADELRGTAPGVGPGTTLLVTDIQVCGFPGSRDLGWLAS